MGVTPWKGKDHTGMSAQREDDEEKEGNWKVGVSVIVVCAAAIIGAGVFSVVYGKLVGFDVSICPPPPPRYSHGTMLFRRNTTTKTYNHIADYSCDGGYTLLGPARRTCSKEGKWIPEQFA